MVFIWKEEKNKQTAMKKRLGLSIPRLTALSKQHIAVAEVVMIYHSLIWSPISFFQSRLAILSLDYLCFQMGKDMSQFIDVDVNNVL